MAEPSRWFVHGRIAVLASALVLAGCGGSLPSAAAPTPTAAPLPTLDPGQAARGRQVYLRHCASCHGPNAEGTRNWQQPDTRGNLPPPPHDDGGHTWRHPNAQLVEIIRGGQRDPFNRTSELTMPPFAGRLSDEEIVAVIAYFESLWSAEHRSFQEEQNRRPPTTTGRGE